MPISMAIVIAMMGCRARVLHRQQRRHNLYNSVPSAESNPMMGRVATMALLRNAYATSLALALDHDIECKDLINVIGSQTTYS